MGCTRFAAASGGVLSRSENAGIEAGMRRRSKRAPNLSESTGKIGQELPSNQPAPLVPSYMDEPAQGPQQGRPPAPRPAASQEQARPATTHERAPKPERLPRP